MRFVSMRVAAACIVVALSGCANNNNIYDMFYKPTATPRSAFDAFSGEPKLAYGTGNYHNDILKMYSDGYGEVGYSAFVGPKQTSGYAISEGKRQGAAVVLLRNTNKPWDIPGVQVRGDYNADRFEQVALFFAPLKRTGFGTWTRNGGDGGVVVEAVRTGSPAAAAGILPGDTLLKMDGEAIRDRNSFGDALAKARNRTVDISLDRDGQTVTKTATVSAAW